MPEHKPIRLRKVAEGELTPEMFSAIFQDHGEESNHICPVCHDYYCFCDRYAEGEEDERDYCRYCGKEYEDFSDLGCSACDVRQARGFDEMVTTLAATYDRLDDLDTWEKSKALAKFGVNHGNANR